MVPCSYDRNIVDLDAAHEQVVSGISVIQVNQPLPTSTPEQSQTRGVPIPVVLSIDTETQTIMRFQSRTVFTLGTIHTTSIYAEVVPRLALQHEHLLHTVLATTLLHDRALARNSRPSTVESYHFGQAAALFNKRLSSTISENDRDALWATAVYLCAMACSTVNSSNPEDVYPLRPSSSTDLEWLRMQAGLKVIWLMADLHGRKSILSQVEFDVKGNCVFPESSPSGIVGLLPKLVDLCDLTSFSTGENNPYHTAVSQLSWMLKLEGTPANMLQFMVFAGGMAADFETLLRRKDPRALLLLGLWYSKLVESAWWMSSRAIVESESIYRYLHRFHRSEFRILGLLEPVRKAYCSVR